MELLQVDAVGDDGDGGGGGPGGGGGGGVHGVGTGVAAEATDAAGVDEIAELSQPLPAVDVVDAAAFDFGGTEGDDIRVPTPPGEVPHPAAGMDVGGVSQVAHAHGRLPPVVPGCPPPGS